MPILSATSSVISAPVRSEAWLCAVAERQVRPLAHEAAHVVRRRAIGHECVILEPIYWITDASASLNQLDRVIANPDTIAKNA